MKTKYRMGTRGSKLARAQSKWLLESLQEKFPGIEFETVIISTRGDRDQKTSLSDFIERGVFTKSIEEALLKGQIDFAVHSLKDLPSKLPDGLKLLEKPPRREDYRDVLLVRTDFNSIDSPVFGTGSLRRQVQILENFPKGIVKNIRGNVDTRIKKLLNREYDGIILAQAGLNRLGLNKEKIEMMGIRCIDLDNFVPAPTQGILGIEIREEDIELEKLLLSLGDSETAIQMKAERLFLSSLEGNCKFPVGCLCKIEGDRFSLEGLYGNQEGDILKDHTEWNGLEHLEERTLSFAENFRSKKSGKVYLTGAGCGDPELITVKAVKALQSADIVVYDALINPVLLLECKEKVRLVYVGKRSNCHTMSQEEINQVLIQEARKGKNVVRLKGGDPYVFGRGGEEGEYLRKHQIPFEVIPGVTSAIAGPAYAGIPVTHRCDAQSFMVLTGHLKEDGKEHDWKNIAEFRGTLIFLMGVKNLQFIKNQLLDNGKDPHTPVALIENATLPEQRTIITDLKNVNKTAERYGLKPPGLIVIGNVVKYHKDLKNDFASKPLYGKKILVTRARTQASELSKKLIELGAIPIEFPTIKIEESQEGIKELKSKIKSIDTFSHLIFTSTNSVDIFFKVLKGLGLDSRALFGLVIGVIGKATGLRLEHFGIKADFMPKAFQAEDLVESLMPTLRDDSKILLPRSADARRYINEVLRDRVDLHEIRIYRTVPDGSNKNEIRHLIEEKKVDYALFTSSSTIKNYLSFFPARTLRETGCISIGPITSQALQENGIQVHSEAREFTIEGLIEALIETEKKDATDKT